MPLSSTVPLQWKLSQVFGETIPTEEPQDADNVSAIEFDKRGDYIAVGDQGGRVVIFETTDRENTLKHRHSRQELEKLDLVPDQHPEYQYKTEFQSHEPEFDYLKSLEIGEKINKVKWCPTPNESLFILSTNDKTIKLWKVKDHKLKQEKETETPPFAFSENVFLAEQSFISGQETSSVSNGYSLEWKEECMANNKPSPEEVHTKIAPTEGTARARCRKVYGHAHAFNIKAISNNSDGETFISADDLRINLWNLEISNQCFNIIDMKPSNMEDLTEIITAAEFHPISCNLLAFSTSRGFIRLVDMRQSALCDHSTRMLRNVDSGQKSFLTEIIASISDIKFANDGRYILTRDFMNLKLWDTHMNSSSVETFKIHEHLRPKLCDLYNNDTIFDKFECCFSGDGRDLATGSYSNLLRIFSSGGDGSGERITVEPCQTPNRKQYYQAAGKARRRSSLSNLTRGLYRQVDDPSSVKDELRSNFTSKLLHLAWHPTTSLIACASGNTLFMYYA